MSRGGVLWHTDRRAFMLKPDEITTLDAAARLLADNEQWPAALETLRRAAKAEPRNIGRWLQIAEWQRQAGDTKAAIKTLKTALRLNRSTPRGKTAGEARRGVLDLWQALAEILLEAQQWDEATAACRSILELAPRHHFAREILATALLQNAQVAEAEQVMRELLQISPLDPLHRLRLATLLQLQGRLGEALIEFRRVIETHPDLPIVEEAHEAIEALDRMQTQQILMRASEQILFRLAIERNLDETLAEYGFVLSDNGYETLRQMVWDGHYDDTEPPAPVIH